MIEGVAESLLCQGTNALRTAKPQILEIGFISNFKHFTQYKQSHNNIVRNGQWGVRHLF
jgi:hypothetical protein